MTAPTFLSVFSGIGGFDLGLEQAGWACVGHIENNNFCNRVLERHWPDVPRWGDITTIDTGPERERCSSKSDTGGVGGITGEADEWRSGVHSDDLPDCDLLVGGFPCTDVSIAGRRKGLAGEQSGLFFQFVRLAAALCPTWLLIENVPGLFSSNKGRDFATILAALGDIGYGVAWRVLDSRYFGVAQRRRRVFLVGHLGGPCPAPVLFESKGVCGDSPASRTARTDVAYSLAASVRGSGDGHGNAWNGTCITSGESHLGSEGIAGTLGSARGRGWCDDLERSGAFVVHNGQGDPNWALEQAFALDTQAPSAVTVAGTLGASNTRHPAGTENEADLVVTFNHQSGGDVRLNLGLERSPALQSNQTVALYYSHDYNQDRIYSQGGLAPAVCSQDNAGARRFLTSTGVRRLTPTECERLQGFPDGWTCLCGAQPYDTWDCACPDAPRYAALGNAVTTSVARWIGTRLLAVHHALEY